LLLEKGEQIKPFYGNACYPLLKVNVYQYKYVV
jgi:hypothetical protein